MATTVPLSRPLAPSTRAELSRRLAGLREVTLARADRHRAAAESLTADLDLSDLLDQEFPMSGSLEVERDRDLMLAERADRRVAETEEALARLVSGRYGVCERCGTAIAVARLRAVPETTRCVDCADPHRRRR